MKDAHLRLGLLEYERHSEKISTRIRVRVSHYIGEDADAHLLSVFGNDSDVGAITAAVYDQVLTKLASKIENRILRAIGKIASNYVAYIHGAKFFLEPDFDYYRKWVRYATAPPWDIPVAVDATPILALDSL